MDKPMLAEIAKKAPEGAQYYNSLTGQFMKYEHPFVLACSDGGVWFQSSFDMTDLSDGSFIYPLPVRKSIDDATPAEWDAASRAARYGEPTPEEDRAWKEKERKMTPSEVAEGMINGTVTWDDGAIPDNVNHPPHYQLRPGYEVYDLRQDLAKKAAQAAVPYAQFSDWDRAIEYQLRCWQKNGLEDLKKARWYLDQLISKLEGGE